MAQIFPKWTNEVHKIATPILGVAAAFAVFVIWYWWAPAHTDVGYRPVQPIPYSHKLHVQKLGLDCRYCHNYVEQGPHAGVPPTQTCLNCHNVVLKDSPKLAWLRQAKLKDGTHGEIDEHAPSTPWKRIHKIPDYAYFDHSAHVTQGVGCQSCHGRIDKMEVVQQVEPLSMGWCLECHRNIRHFPENGFEPAEVLRPVDQITLMGWPEAYAKDYQSWIPKARAKAETLQPPTVECSGCHR